MAFQATKENEQLAGTKMARCSQNGIAGHERELFDDKTAEVSDGSQ